MPRALVGILVVVAVLLVAGLALVRECAFDPGMGAVKRACACRGIEWELYDGRAHDGARKTICLGVVEASTCVSVEGGPAIRCPR